MAFFMKRSYDPLRMCVCVKEDIAFCIKFYGVAKRQRYENEDDKQVLVSKRCPSPRAHTNWAIR